MKQETYDKVLSCLSDKRKTTCLIAKESWKCFNTAERALKQITEDGLAKKLRIKSKSSASKNVWVLK